MRTEVFQPEGNYFDKYGSENPVVKRLMKAFFHSFDNLLQVSGIGRGGIALKPDVEKEK